MLTKIITLLLFISGSFGILICENGLYCASDEDCQIGNRCIDFVAEKLNSTRCVPRDDLDDTFVCSLSHKSCECKYKFIMIFCLSISFYFQLCLAVLDGVTPAVNYVTRFFHPTVPCRPSLFQYLQ